MSISFTSTCPGCVTAYTIAAAISSLVSGGIDRSQDRAGPMPDEAPVTNATFPSNFPDMTTPCLTYLLLLFAAFRPGHGAPVRPAAAALDTLHRARRWLSHDMPADYLPSACQLPLTRNAPPACPVSLIDKKR